MPGAVQEVPELPDDQVRRRQLCFTRCQLVPKNSPPSLKLTRAPLPRGLMTPEKFENLGFNGGVGADAPRAAVDDAAGEKEKQDKKKGFLAGQRYAEKRGTGSTSF